MSSALWAAPLAQGCSAGDAAWWGATGLVAAALVWVVRRWADPSRSPFERGAAYYAGDADPSPAASWGPFIQTRRYVRPVVLPNASPSGVWVVWQRYSFSGEQAPYTILTCLDGARVALRLPYDERWTGGAAAGGLTVRNASMYHGAYREELEWLSHSCAPASDSIAASALSVADDREMPYPVAAMELSREEATQLAPLLTALTQRQQLVDRFRALCETVRPWSRPLVAPQADTLWADAHGSWLLDTVTAQGVSSFGDPLTETERALILNRIDTVPRNDDLFRVAAPALQDFVGALVASHRALLELTERLKDAVAWIPTLPARLRERVAMLDPAEWEVACADPRRVLIHRTTTPTGVFAVRQFFYRSAGAFQEMTYLVAMTEGESAEPLVCEWRAQQDGKGFWIKGVAAATVSALKEAFTTGRWSDALGPKNFRAPAEPANAYVFPDMTPPFEAWELLPKHAAAVRRAWVGAQTGTETDARESLAALIPQLDLPAAHYPRPIDAR
ncbi:MAG: hypothetical protein HY696_00180 [Deltaproteobacteria bacterium]|nr:hypothetical protein [Deltaproteobacteria bacterium]